KGVEANARRILADPGDTRRDEAERTLSAVATELVRRDAAERERIQAEATAIRTEIEDLGLLERALLAFSKAPLNDKETEALQIVADRPGITGSELAKQLGY